jgi:hypothetical protein
MTRLARQLVEGLAQAYKHAHPEEERTAAPALSAEQVEASAVAALHAAFYGTPPTATEEEA